MPDSALDRAGPTPVPVADWLVATAELLRSRPARLGAVRLVAVDGPSGSGKTRAAACLAGHLQGGPSTVAVLSTDLLATWEHPFDWWSELETGVLQPLSAGRAGRLPTVTWSRGRSGPGPVIDVPPADVLILEGVSSSRRAVSARLTAALWVEHPSRAARLERAVARDGEAGRAALRQWQRDENAFFATDRPRSRADVIIPG